MARARTSIGDLADGVLRQVEAERLVKTAASTYPGEKKTDLGQQMQKLAEEVRSEAHNQISYADLNEFRKRYDV